jgi:hypothetical protein
MSRWISRTLVVVGSTAVLVLGAAAHGFHSSARRASASTATEPRSTKPPQRALGPALRVSLVKLLVDPADNSAAVIVRVENPDARRPVVNAPIAIELLDRAGGIVGTNADAGTNPLLVHVPYIDAGESTVFVSDTIATSAAPSKVRASATANFSPTRRARLGVRPRGLRVTPFGWLADAALVNSRSTEPRMVLLQAVVRRMGKVVAAGTTILEIPPHGRPTNFEIALVGDAKGGVLRVWAPPQ